MPGFRRRRPTACCTHLATQQAVSQLPHTCPRALCWSYHLHFCRWLLHVHAAKPLNKVLYLEIRNQQKNFGSSRCQRIGNIDISTNTIEKPQNMLCISHLSHLKKSKLINLNPHRCSWDSCCVWFGFKSMPSSIICWRFKRSTRSTMTQIHNSTSGSNHFNFIPSAMKWTLFEKNLLISGHCIAWIKRPNSFPQISCCWNSGCRKLDASPPWPGKYHSYKTHTEIWELGYILSWQILPSLKKKFQGDYWASSWWHGRSRG